MTSKEKPSMKNLNLLGTIFPTLQNRSWRGRSQSQAIENSNDDDDGSSWQDLISLLSGKKILQDHCSELSDLPVPIQRFSRVHSMRKWKDFPVNELILDYINERVIVIDFSWQNLMNNVKSVQERSPSTSIARLFNTMIGSNPVTGIENYFNDLGPISLTCDYACALEVTRLYMQVATKILFKRSPKAPAKREIPTIIKMTRDILKYDQNGILRSTQSNNGSPSDNIYQPSIPFVEVIEL
jgi:hypothetical protein